MPPRRRGDTPLRPAEAAFDLEAPASRPDPKFVEIGPPGEGDEHDAIPSFHAPEKKVAGPTIQRGRIQVRDPGDTAGVSARYSYPMAAPVTAPTPGLVARIAENGGRPMPERADRQPPAMP